MKTIVNCEVNKPYIIKKLHTEGALRQRLISFGILKGREIKFLRATPTKSTIEIKVGKMNIAMRADEAIKIEIA